LELFELLGDHDADSQWGESRVRRGGSFVLTARFCRAACRVGDWAGLSDWGCGLRVCLVPLPDSGKQGKRASTDESDQARRHAAADPDEHGDASWISNAPAMPTREFLELSVPPIPQAVPIRCIESKDGGTWSSNLGPLDFYQTQRDNPIAFANVTKLVIGKAPTTENDRGRISLESFPSDLESLFPNLTHLYLWQIDSLTQLPRLPANIQVLDVRGCRNLAHWGDQPHINSWALHLEELFLDHTQLPDLEISDIPTLPHLIELSFRGCETLSGLFIKDMIKACSALRFLDLSDCLQLVESLPELPSDLRVLKLNACSNLERLPRILPPSLRRLELKGASKLGRLPLIPARMDLLDLRDTTSLRKMPTFEWHSLTESLPNSDPVPIETWDPNQRTWPNSQWIVQPSTPRPRTLYLHGSGIERNLDLEGDSEDENVAVSVHLDLLEKDFVAYRDIKVILLGNGRCGKSSLARLLQNGTFDEFQPTTHGIMLWKLTQQLTPIANDGSPDAQSPTAQLNVWDFAGQDLYHGTHRLFLQHNAIYIVLDSPPDLPGSNESSDATERAQEALERSWGFGDQPRSPSYWHRMIESLGANPLTQQPPPVLFVRSKVDRYSAPDSSRSFPQGVDTVSISAKSIAEILAKIGGPNPMDLAFETLQPKGLSPTEQALFAEFQTLIRWIRQKVRSLLGPFERHRIPKSAMAVVDEIKKLTTENDRAYEQHQQSIAFASDQPSVCQSPKPYISVDEFNAWVRQHCEHYSQRPEELLKRFHRSGLVYYDPQYLENDIVIDQRWAIHGIYALFDRSSERSVLPSIRSRMGTIAWSELSECWRSYGYPDSAHRLFANFMLSCGMVFELLTKEESVRDEPLLSFPSFYPTREERLDQNNSARRHVIPLKEELDVLKDSPPLDQIVFESISESEVRSLLSGLGAQWSRSSHAYRWGCTIKRAEPRKAVFWMDWERNQEDQYLHRLVLRFYYELDEEFVSWIRETFEMVLCRSKGWSKETFAKHWPVSRSPEFNEMRGPSLRRLKDERMKEAVRVYVAFSY
ncbi:MAG: COR domain-containing protein, partial [Pirellula sp.]